MSSTAWNVQVWAVIYTKPGVDVMEDFGTENCRGYFREICSQRHQWNLNLDLSQPANFPSYPDPDLSDEEDEREANELERLRILEEVTCLKWRDLQVKVLNLGI